MSFLVLGNFRWNHNFYSVSWFALFWAKRIFWPKQKVCTKMHVFSPFPTQIQCQAIFAKKKPFFFDFSHFWMTTLKKETIFIGSFWPFPFSFFFNFFYFYFSNIKKEKTKNAIFFSKTSFLTSPKFCPNKTLFWHNVTLFVFSKIPENTIKMGKTVKKLGPNFNTRLGPIFNARNPKSWTRF